nr:thiamine-phosphate kinase [Candidatus Pandoraea novymonadis]
MINQFFTNATQLRKHVALGIGDDCALLQLTDDEQLAISTDMLVEGQHFFPDVDPHALGHKTLAVNLSDIAAMGARPLGFTLALSLPDSNPSWLQPFSEGLSALANNYSCPLIGGDTTRGPRNLCITIFGAVPEKYALRRDAAKAGDDIWISGKLGDARLALGCLRGEWPLDPAALAQTRRALEWPEPRISLGLALRGIAHAAIDISDGLLDSLQHILEQSGLALRINVDAIPRSTWLSTQPLPIQRQCTLTGGDDYEICFCAPPSQRLQIKKISENLNLSATRIGKMTLCDTDHPSIVLHDRAFNIIEIDFKCFDHFSNEY